MSNGTEPSNPSHMSFYSHSDQIVNQVLDELGVGWDPKQVKKRKLMHMLNDIEKLNGSVSSMIIRRFNMEMTLRRERLAFAMDKKYHLKKF